jgi:creatinine amidohydrolase/Fe(II)-dependent formamide hydrolase-like protein
VSICRATASTTARVAPQKPACECSFLLAHGDPFHIRALKTADKRKLHVMELYDVNCGDILTKQQNAKHACEAETSVMMFLYPKTIRQKNIEDFETPFEVFKAYLSHKKTGRIKDSPGCQGFPSYATARKGKLIVSRMQKEALSWIRKLEN